MSEIVEKRRDEPVFPGDELMPYAPFEATDSIDIAAPPDEIWPWLVQMGCRRGGFYSIDALDNAGEPSAREIHPELQTLAVGDVIPATPRGQDGFEVLRLEPPRVLVLGGLVDLETRRQLAFAATRPAHYWQSTWSFRLEPLDRAEIEPRHQAGLKPRHYTRRDECHTRLTVRARGVCSRGDWWRVAWLIAAHKYMQRAQLQHLAARAEQRLPRDGWRDIAEGVKGAAVMVAAAATPFLRERRRHAGLDPASAARAYPGDEIVRDPLWSWTHAIEIEAPAEDVWPWVAQIGADRGGFYSYQWLENVAGCALRNAETIHPEWEVREGQELVVHPNLAGLVVVAVERGRHFLAHAPADEKARAQGRAWVTVTWLFAIEPLGPRRCRVISRYRAACSPDFKTRISFGPTLVEPVGFAMDRRMLEGVKHRVERRAQALTTRHRIDRPSTAA